MARDWSHAEVLKAIFPLLDGRDLVSCMAVSRLWRDAAMDDYLWKCLCAQRWPSVCSRPPPALSFRRLYRTFSRYPPFKPPLPPPQLSLHLLDFYIDLWSEQRLLFSEAVPGASLCSGAKDPPRDTEYRMTMRVEPGLTVELRRSVTASVLVGRRDTNKMACILNRGIFDYVDRSSCRAMAYDYLSFSPAHPFVSGVRAWVSLLFAAANEDDIVDVLGIVIDFCDAASSEEEVLWLLDMLDWK